MSEEKRLWFCHIVVQLCERHDPTVYLAETREEALNIIRDINKKVWTPHYEKVLLAESEVYIDRYRYCVMCAEDYEYRP